MEKNLVIIPTYDESENISAIVKAIWQHVPTLQILVVDDNSPDGTADVVKSLQSQYSEKLHLLKRSGKLGLGTAYIAGFKWAISHGFSAVIEMDADFSHNPDILPTMLAELKQHSVVVGSRYVPGGGSQNWHFLRRWISKFGSLYARTILSLNVCDMTGGFNAWRIEVLKRIRPETITSEGYSFQIELKYRAHLAGYRIKEIPIIFQERREGQSKMSGKIILEAMLRVWSLRFNASSYKSLDHEATEVGGH